MNGPEPKIEIFKPFGEAFELMKKILFQPFDLGKWCVIGFAAFLCGHFAAGGFNFPTQFMDSHRDHPHRSADFSGFAHWKPWLPIVIGGFLIFVVVVSWLKSRGIFIFTDCIVRNRGAIAEPWREYRKEGNSYFLFVLGILLCYLVVIGTVAVILIPMGVFAGKQHESISVPLILVMIFVFLLWMGISIFVSVVTYFMAPVMYRRRCSALDAFRDVVRLISDNPGPFVLFCLFAIVLFLAMLAIGSVATCATCCLAALPYIGTVILLPVFVCLRAFGLLFLRQFGPDYDVWQGLQAEPVSGPPPLPIPPPLES